MMVEMNVEECNKTSFSRDRGPLDPHIFGEISKEDGVVSDEIMKESQRIQHEIKTLLEQVFIQPTKKPVNIRNNLIAFCV